MAKTKTNVVAKQEVKPKAKALDYSITIRVGDEVSLFETDSIEEALVNFKPTKLCGKISITIIKSEKTFIKLYTVFQARRLFNNDVSAIILAKYATLALN